MHLFRLLTLLLLSFPLCLRAQDEALFIPRDIKSAYDAGYRSYTGMPGPEYFQNRVNYEIYADLDPVSRKLTGMEKVEYINNSPYFLRFMVISLFHNVFREGEKRGKEVNPQDVGKGVTLTSITVNGRELDPDNAAYKQFETSTNTIFPVSCGADEKIRLEVTWELRLPEKTHERFGPVDETSAFVGYWFPRIAVLDDISGWDVFDYNIVSETYNEYGNYDVHISMPENYVVWATGRLQNPGEVLSKKIAKRYDAARNSNEIINIIEKADLKKGKITAKERNTWHFSAENVSDFAFGYSDHHLWDAVMATPQKGQDVFVESAYLPSSRNFRDVAGIAAWAVEQLADSIPGIGFPFPEMCVFNGMDGMEYPMIVNDREEDQDDTWFLTVHEITHSFFPFMVGVNQRRHGWIDEGLVTMLGTNLHLRKTDEPDFREIYLNWYPRFAGTQEDVPMLVNSAFIPYELFQQHEYVRPTTAFYILSDILGQETFNRCLREFIHRWEWKHPTPYDLFFTFNEVSGENLNWFFQPWFIEFAYPDLGIDSVVDNSGKPWVDIKNVGGMPFPSALEVYYEDGTREKTLLDARIWKATDIYRLNLDINKSPAKLVLHTEGYPDVNERNDFWEKE